MENLSKVFQKQRKKTHEKIEFHNYRLTVVEKCLEKCLGWGRGKLYFLLSFYDVIMCFYFFFKCKK